MIFLLIILVIFLLVIGGIYLGWFTPTEGAAVGVAGTAIIAFFTKSFGVKEFKEVVEDTATSTAMIFVILLGAEFFGLVGMILGVPAVAILNVLFTRGILQYKNSPLYADQ